MAPRLILGRYPEPTMLKSLKPGYEGPRVAYDYSTDELLGEHVIHALIATTRGFDFRIDYGSEHTAEISVLGLPFPTIIASQSPHTRNKQASFFEKEDIFSKTEMRFVSVTTPLEMKLFDIEHDKPVIFHIMEYLVNLRNNTEIQNSITEAYSKDIKVQDVFMENPSHPFLIHAQVVWSMGRKLNALANICRALRMDPRIECDLLDIRFGHPSLKHLAIRPLKYFVRPSVLTMGGHTAGMYDSPQSPCVVLTPPEVIQEKPFNLTDHPNIELSYEGRDLREYLSDDTITSFDETNQVFNIGSNEQLQQLLTLLVQLRDSPPPPPSSKELAATARHLRRVQERRSREKSAKDSPLSRFAASNSMRQSQVQRHVERRPQA